MRSIGRLLVFIILAPLLFCGCGGGKSKGSGGANVRKPMKVLEETLQVSDEATLKEVYRLLESAIWKRYGVTDSSSKQSKVYARAGKDIRSGKSPLESDVREMLDNARAASDERAERDAEDKAKGIKHLLPEESLEKAWEALKSARPELDGYSGRKLIADAMHTIWPYSRSFYFKRVPGLVPPKDFEPPPVDDKYAHFFTIKSYAGDPVFNELRALKDEELPAGAALPLLSLRRVPDAGMKREGYGDLTDDVLVKRYGERMLPAVIEYLSDPEKYGFKDQGYPPVEVLALARTWSDESKALIQRQAFMSGWDDAYRMLEGPYTPALLAEFKDSPYGAPDRP